VGLLRGLEVIESVFLFGVDASDPRFALAFKAFLRAVRMMEWPRLRTVKVQAVADGVDHEAGEMWNELVACLAKLGVEGGEGVVAGVRVRAVPWSAETGRFAED
jgi:hypothetical protein